MGLKKLMEDLNLKSFDELYDFLNDPKNKDNPIVKEYNDFFKYVKVMENEE